jgi:hypothetical protein
MDVDPAEADVLPGEAASVGQIPVGAVLASAGDLRAPGGESVAQGGALGQFEAAVGTIRIGLRVVDRRGLFSGEHPAEPVPLHLRHVLDEACQREAGRRHGRDGGLLIVQALALQGEGGAVKVKPAFERGALVGVQGWHRPFDGIHRSIITSRCANRMPSMSTGFRRTLARTLRLRSRPMPKPGRQRGHHAARGIAHRLAGEAADRNDLTVLTPCGDECDARRITSETPETSSPARR